MKMALQALKESTLPTAARSCRLTPPSSPSRRSTARMTSTTVYKSKLLAAVDANLEAFNLGSSLTANASPSTSSLTLSTTSKVDPKKLFVPGRSASQGRSSSQTESIDPFFTPNASCKPSSQHNKKPTSGSSTSTNASEASRKTRKVLPNSHVDTQNKLRSSIPKKQKLYSYTDYSPAPAIVYTRHEEEANDLVQALKGPLGFDLEWRVFMRRNQSPMERRTALVQICDARMILLIQVSAMKKFPQKVKEILESADIVKTGANIRNDGQKLFRDFGVLSANLVELGAFAQQADPKFHEVYTRSIVSLARMVDMYTSKILDKGKVRTGNWEAEPLVQEQLEYAANDAHSALMVYNHLAEIAAANSSTLSPTSYASDLKKDYACGKLMRQTTRTKSSSSSSATSMISRSSSATRQSFASSSSGTSTPWPNTEVKPGDPPRPQHMRAYNLWHHKGMPLGDMCAKLRSRDNPLAESTVISYVVRALQADPSLPFSMECLKSFVQLEAGSWARHREWIFFMDAESRAN